MPNATPVAPAAGLPAAAAAVVPAAGLAAADQAFDDVFRQLTGGLLTTSAQAGEALAEAEFDAMVEGEGLAGDPAGDALPVGVVPVPVMFTLPAVMTPLVGDGGGGETLADEAAGVATAADVAASGPVAAPRANASATLPGAAAPGAAPFEAAAATAPADGAATPAVAEDADVLAALNLPAESAGAATPATEVEAHVRGLDRRRGMRETPARARTFDTAAVETPAGTPAAATTITPGTAEAPAPAVAPAETAGGTTRELPATAERAFALQRALARQSENTHRDGAAPGLTAQAAQAGASNGGAETGSGDTPHEKKHGRTSTATFAPGATLPAAATSTAQAAAAPGLAHEPQTDTAASGPAAGAAWRAALAASALPDLAGAASEAGRAATSAGVVAGLPPVVELPAFRDRGPVVATPLAMPELDAATGESVHTQIVKSIRMQWTGGLGEARVTLKPEYLGEVTASIKVEQGVVTATLQADTPEVRRWMESHTATLRDALVDHGLKLDRLTVGEPDRQAAQGDRQSKSRQQPRQQAPRPRARRDASETDPPFEVTTD